MKMRKWKVRYYQYGNKREHVFNVEAVSDGEAVNEAIKKIEKMEDKLAKKELTSEDWIAKVDEIVKPDDKPVVKEGHVHGEFWREEFGKCHNASCGCFCCRCSGFLCGCPCHRSK